MAAFFQQLTPALWVEAKKALRSRTFWMTALGMALITGICGLFMYILKDPEQARRLGLLGAKAQFLGGTADWPSFFNLVLVMLSMAGLIIFGFIFVWIFGREFSDKTVYDLLALPTSRVVIVVSKCLVALVWCTALLLMGFALMLVFGAVLQLPGWSGAVVWRGFGLLMASGGLTLVVCLPFSLVASVTRSYLPALGCIFLILILSQVITQLGNGAYFPWTVPMLFSGAAEALSGKTADPLGSISYVITALTGVISLGIMGWWWRKADQG
jgi:ABC-2 type transport system permease protein